MRALHSRQRDFAEIVVHARHLRALAQVISLECINTGALVTGCPGGACACEHSHSSQYSEKRSSLHGLTFDPARSSRACATISFTPSITSVTGNGIPSLTVPSMPP